MAIILTLLAITLVVANTRVGFSRPSAVIRTPGATELEAYNQYIVGFSTELLNLSDLNYAATAFFQGVTAEGEEAMGRAQGGGYSSIHQAEREVRVDEGNGEGTAVGDQVRGLDSDL